MESEAAAKTAVPEKERSSHLSSAAAFVEGGIQDACDESCSICLEAFSITDPSTVTTCKHEFHLQCILEWCQRSSQCPMCWQSIALKDPASQELLEAIERERSVRINRTRMPEVFRHPLVDFDLQQLSEDGSDSDVEEGILQGFADAAADMGISHRLARRGMHILSGGHNRAQLLVFSRHPSDANGGTLPASSAQAGGDSEGYRTMLVGSSSASSLGEEAPPLLLEHRPGAAVRYGSGTTGANTPGSPMPLRSDVESTPVNKTRAGPSDLHSFSETLKGRFSAVSMRYKESITRSTRGWKEKYFSRNNAVADICSDVKREVNTGFANLTRIMERLDTRESRRGATSSSPHTSEGFLHVEPTNVRIAQDNVLARDGNSLPSAGTGRASDFN